jgi:hypothetical protein
MSEKLTTTERIVEEVDGDNLVFRLLVNDKEACWARILPYSVLVEIQTTKGEEGKGYGKKLLTHIEKVAKEHNVMVMKTSDIDPCDYKVVSFFKNMGYRFKPIEGDETKFIEAEKPLENKILELIRKIDSRKSDLFKFRDVFGPSWFSVFYCIGVLYAFVMPIVIFATTSLVDKVVIALALVAVIVSIFSILAEFAEESIVIVNFKRMVKKNSVEENKKPLLKALIKMKAQNREFNLEQIYNMNKDIFTEEKLLEKLYKT